MSPPKKIWIGKSSKRTSFLLILFLCITCVTLIVVNSSIGNESVSKEELKEEIQEPITEKVVPVEEVTPDLQTEFFSKEEGKALLYYAVVNDSVRFFKTQGVDPATGQTLLPVTQEIVDQYKESIAVPKEELAIADTREYKVNEIKIIKKEKKPVVKKKPKRESIWNTKLFNSNQVDEISLFVFNENDQIDSLLTERFKKEFDAKDYFVTPDIIFEDMLTPMITDRLKNSDIEYFDGNLKKYTDYVCIGIVAYSYKENAYRNDLTDCTLRIDYFIYDAGSGEHVFTEQDKLLGSGQNKKLARQDAVEKFIL